MKSFDGEFWTWEQLDAIEDSPRELLTEVLGSSRPILFVEGSRGSLDHSIYRSVYPTWHVVARRNCADVIQSVKVLRKNASLTGLSDVAGIVDRDVRSDDEIADLAENRIHVPGVAEIENLLCTPEILEIVASRLEKDPSGIVSEAGNVVFGQLGADKERQILRRASREVLRRLSFSPPSRGGEPALKTAVRASLNKIDVAGIYQSHAAEFERVLETRDYAGALRIFKRKGLANQIGRKIGFAKANLVAFVLRLFKSDESSRLVEAAKLYLPSIDGSAEASP